VEDAGRGEPLPGQPIQSYRKLPVPLNSLSKRAEQQLVHERQFDQSRASQTQKNRSRFRSRGRFTDTWRTASCWRSAKFSAAMAARSPSTARKKKTIALTTPQFGLREAA
jgi:hypothetical protein